MKTLTIVKDAYIENSVRVNYFDNNAIRKEKRIKDYFSLGISLSGDLPNYEQMFEEVNVVYPNLIFCETKPL